MISDHATDYYYHLGIVFPDRRFSVKDLKKLTPRMDQAGLDYSKSTFAANDAIFENVRPDSPERTLYRVTHKFLAISHQFVSDVQFETFCKMAETYISTVTETLQVAAWVSRECIVQKLAPCPGGEDSRAYLSQAVLRLDSVNLGAFEKQPVGVGIRLVFPAEKETPVEYEVKVESFIRDPSRLFLQTHARFLRPLPTNDAKPAVGCLRQTKEFLEDRVFPFLG